MLMERESQRNMTNALPSTSIREATTLMTIRENGSTQRGKKNSNLQYDYCKLKRYTREGCYKLIGYHADSTYKRKPIATTAHNVTVEEHKG